MPRINPIYQEHSILLAKKKYKEGNIIACFATKTHGLVWANAIGAAKVSKRFNGAFEFFNLIKADFLPPRSHGFEVYNIENYSLVENLKGFEDNFEKYNLACFLLELSQNTLRENLKDKESENSFKLLWSALKNILKTNNEAELSLQFLLRLFCINGFAHDVLEYNSPYTNIMEAWMLNHKTEESIPAVKLNRIIKELSEKVIERKLKTLKYL